MAIKKTRFVEIDSVDFDAKIKLELIEGATTRDKVVITLEDKKIELYSADLRAAINAL
jgi:hypothetical protein